MYSLLFLTLVSFALALVLTPLVRNAALRLGFVDRPDQGRKLHKTAVPRVGGVPIVFAFAAAFAVLMLTNAGGSKLVISKLPFVIHLLPAVAIIFITGLLDDLWGLKPWQKLIGQLLAASLACWSGVLIHGLAGHTFASGWWMYPLTVFWLIGCANAFNLIDGIDGLAAGVGLFATLTTFCAAALKGDYTLMLATAPLIGALLAFLRYNFNPASIFLGDCGSLTIGFVLGCYGVIWSQKSATLLGMTAPLLALSIPLLDTALAIARRLLRGQKIFGGDRGHIHHRLLDRGLSPRRVALLLYGVCGLAAALSVMQSVAKGQFAGIVLVIFCVAAWVGIQFLGYSEFRVAGRLFRPRMFRRMLNAQLNIQALGRHLEKASTVEQCWTLIRDAAFAFGFTSVSIRLDHAVLTDRRDGGTADSWTVTVPLSRDAFVKLSCNYDNSVEPIIGPLTALLRRVLTPKLSELQRGRRTEETAKHDTFVRIL
ncbi:MAG TPA: MraY family glycosyltransferase [Bryobacteraceae bacterium]|nr:MraY family glycosyltransferase [Bryobacteraceae bacterium]